MGSVLRQAMQSLLGVVVLGCARDNAVLVPPSESDGVTATKMLGTLAVTLSVPDGVQRGTPVVISVDLDNRGDTAVRLDAPGDNSVPPFDAIVTRASGDTVWQEPPSGATRLAVLRENPEIAPGKTQPYGTARWDQTDPSGRQITPGAYHVWALVYAPAPWGLTRVGPVILMVQ